MEWVSSLKSDKFISLELICKHCQYSSNFYSQLSLHSAKQNQIRFLKYKNKIGLLQISSKTEVNVRYFLGVFFPTWLDCFRQKFQPNEITRVQIFGAWKKWLMKTFISFGLFFISANFFSTIFKTNCYLKKNAVVWHFGMIMPTVGNPFWVFLYRFVFLFYFVLIFFFLHLIRDSLHFREPVNYHFFHCFFFILKYV